jgi:hypothetical protein
MGKDGTRISLLVTAELKEDGFSAKLEIDGYLSPTPIYCYSGNRASILLR